MAKDENMDYDKMIDSFVIKCKNNRVQYIRIYACGLPSYG